MTINRKNYKRGDKRSVSKTINALGIEATMGFNHNTHLHQKQNNVVAIVYTTQR